jgi:hypothetical protein
VRTHAHTRQRRSYIAMLFVGEREKVEIEQHDVTTELPYKMSTELPVRSTFFTLLKFTKYRPIIIQLEMHCSSATNEAEIKVGVQGEQCRV